MSPPGSRPGIVAGPSPDSSPSALPAAAADASGGLRSSTAATTSPRQTSTATSQAITATSPTAETPAGPHAARTQDAALDDAQSTAHRRLLRAMPWVSVVFGASAAGLLFWVWKETPSRLPALGAAIGALFSGGKEASIPLGAGYGVPTWLVGTTIFLVDVCAVSILFPILIRGMDHLEATSGFFGELLRVGRKQANRRRAWVDRWGAAGLYLFSIVPFAFNGPPQGIVLGRLAGLRTTQIAAAIAGAMVTTTVAWSIVAHFAAAWLKTVNPRLPLYVSIAITATVVVLAITGVVRERIAARHLQDDETA